MTKIDAPVFVIHGTADEEIPVKHGQLLHDNSKVKYDPFFVDGAGHNNLLEIADETYFTKIHAFLDTLLAAPPAPPAP